MKKYTYRELKETIIPAIERTIKMSEINSRSYLVPYWENRLKKAKMQLKKVSDIEKYKHHNVEVFTSAEVKGKHRDYCLCYKCAKLNIKDSENNCPIAKAIFDNSIKYHVTTPVFECPEFVEL